MSYNTLHKAWEKERNEEELQDIPDTLLHEMKDYITTLNRTPTDEDTLSGQLTRKEKEYANRMLRELTENRLRKIITREAMGESIDAQAMTPEEQRLHSNLRQLISGYRQGADLPEIIDEPDQARPIPSKPAPVKRKKSTPQPVIKPGEVELIVVRFLQPIPAIMGIDMKAYGPFQPEELGTIPAQNAENLIKRGIAKKVEVEP